MRQFIIILLCSLFLVGCTNTSNSHYEKKHDGVYYYYAIEEGSYYKIEGADKGSFKDLGCGYGKDKNQVYSFQKSLKTIEEADTSTFELINCSYSKDANNVYFGINSIKNADPNSFEVLNSRYSRDKDNVYYFGGIVEDADPATISFFNKEYTLDYARDTHNAYCKDKKLQNANPEKLEVISWNGYAKDDKNVYQDCELLPMIDSPSFELLGHDCYVKDKNHVYYFNGIIEEADPQSFEIIDTELTFHGEIDSKDKNNLYYRGKKIEGIDINSYEPLEYGNYVRDKNAIYYLRKNDDNEVTQVEFLEENDEVFEFVDGYSLYSWTGNYWFLKTDKAVYLEGYRLENVDPESFASLNDYYSKDKNGVYTGFELTPSGEITFKSLEGVDPRSFEILEVPRFDDEFYGKDINNYYYKGEVIMFEDIDPETMLLMN